MKLYAMTILCALAACAQPARRAALKRGAAAAPSDKPKIVYRWDEQASGVDDDLLSVCFADRQVGYAAGKNNTILKTTDGGKTWRRLLERKPSGDLHGVIFTSPNDGWVLAGLGPLLHTTDGGESWQPAAPLPGPEGFGGGSMLGASRVQLHVPGMGVGVFRSDDGGRSWRPLGAPPSNNWQAVFFVDAQHGWVAGEDGRLAATVDGGATWKAISQPLAASLAKVQFVSPRVGWALPVRGHQGGLLATTDGGATWSTQYAGIETYRPLMDMQFLDAQTGFLLAETNRDQAVLETSNGGKSWRTIGAIAKYSTALSFPETDEGWAVGPHGYIVHYHKVILHP